LDRDRFARIVETHGVATVFDYLRLRGILNAALASHQGHPAVTDPTGPFWLFQHVGLAVRELHRAELRRVSELFRADDLPLIVFKGLALDLLLDNTTQPSFSFDIDTLVRRADVTRARKIFESLGYETGLTIQGGRVRHMPVAIARMTEAAVYSYGQCQPYEMIVPIPALETVAAPVQALLPSLFCTLSGRLHFRMSMDLHYSVNLLTEDLGTRVKPAESVWWEDTQRVPVGDGEFTTFSDRVLSWVLLHRMYVDTMLFQDPALKTLGHVKLLWQAGRFDATQVRAVARRYPYLAPSLHHALRAADSICRLGLSGLEDPANLRAVVAPTMNLGDCLPALLDVGFAFDLDDPAGTGSALPVRTF
jgi:hypothetical protein